MAALTSNAVQPPSLLIHETDMMHRLRCCRMKTNGSLSPHILSTRGQASSAGGRHALPLEVASNACRRQLSSISASRHLRHSTKQARRLLLCGLLPCDVH